VHPIIIQFLLVSVVDVRNEYYVLVNCDECYQTLYRCICNVAFMSFILVDRDETGSDPEFCPISRILSLFFLGSQNRIQMRWKLIYVPYAYQKSNFKYSDSGTVRILNDRIQIGTIHIGFLPFRDGQISRNIHPYL